MADETGNIWTSYSTRDRTIFTLGAVACYWIFLTVAGAVGYPRHPGFEASLMVQPMPIVALLAAAVALVASVLLTAMFAGIAQFEGGLFCAAIGMSALSIQGGPMRYVLMYSSGNGVFVWMIVELLLLFVFVGIGWLALGVLRDFGLLRAEAHDEDKDEQALLTQGALSLAVQVVAMVCLMVLLAQTDKKAQVIWSVAISAYLAALGAQSRP